MAFKLLSKKKNNRPLYIFSLSIIAAAIIISLAILLVLVKPAPNPNTNNQTSGQNGTISIDDDPMLGSANAKVTIVEFSEFVCPFCGRFARDTFPQIKANYIDTGKVKFVFRDFIVHPTAQIASEASQCAYEQGNDKYWAYNEYLFNHQSALTSDDLKAYAATLGLDTAKFDACLDSGKYTVEVEKDTSDGEAYGVNGTPTFFINSKKFVGAQPYAKFQAEIDAALNA